MILKKYVEENLEYTTEQLLNNIVHDYAVNTQDNIIKSKITAKQFITVKTDFIELKAKTVITVLGVAASKNFVERILRNLPIYERKEPLLVELAKTISREMQKMELLKSEYISSLSITTASATSIKTLEEIYGVNPQYELGVKIRQNILIAKEITRYSSFNYAYILKMCELFLLGKVIDILNDKKNKIITIILKDNINNITTLNIFKEYMNIFSPAFYEIQVINQEKEE